MRVMIICICKAVSDRHIDQALNAGAVSLRDLTRQLGVGTCCGKCLPSARELVLRRRLACVGTRSDHSVPSLGMASVTAQRA